MSQQEEAKQNEQECKSERQPSIFINHGGGPMPYLQHIGKLQNKQFDQRFIIKSLQNLGQYINKYKPKALCIISAHWEESTPTVIYQKTPPLYFDYYGFPSQSYQLKYPAPCDIKLTTKIINLLKTVGGYKNVLQNKKRGWDHGVFIPLIIANPEANIPLVQISLHSVTNNKRQTAQNNLRLGAILSTLRDEGVMIIGSGMSYHNMGGFMNPMSKKASVNFNNWLIETMTKKSMKQSIIDMMNWFEAPNALDCHPREEHLLPLLVCLGSNINVKSIDKLFEDYVKNKKIDGKDKKVMNVNVETETGQIIAYSAFALL
eukprot:501939_1